jgi:membrane protein YqaA with SNARE-associated domain
MFEWSGDTGFAALFAAAFISATVFPASSEIVLVMVVKSFPDRLAAAITVATLGNTLGGLTTYGLGRLVPQRYVPKARPIDFVRRYGAFSLLLSWMPIVGDAFCAAAGWLRVPLWAAALAMAVGKAARYIVVAYAARALL